MPLFSDNVKMLYPNRQGYESYTMPSDVFNKKGIGQKYDGGRLIVMGDGGDFEKVDTGIVRLTQNDNVKLCFAISKGYASSVVQSDRGVAIGAGFMQDPKDWRNVEITVVFRYNGGNDAGTIIVGTRTGISDESDPCLASGYKAGIGLTGQSGFFSKQQYLGANVYRNFNVNKMGDSIKGKFVALKFCIYDLDDLGHPTVTSEDARAVKLELYGTTGGSNPFRLLKEGVDQGNWGSSIACGGDAGTVMLYGGPVTTLEWQGGADIDLQSFSIREIDPTTDFDATIQISSLSFTPPQTDTVEEPQIITESIASTPGNISYVYDYKFGSHGSGDGQFLNPHDISFDASGNLFVNDRDRNDVQKFTHTGTFISKFGSSGSGNGQFDVPYAIQHTPDFNNIYVCDRGNNRVQKLDASGNYVSKITTVNGQALNAPEDICFAPNGDMYICDTGNNRIVKLNSSHAFILEWGSLGSGNNQFDHPHSIDLDDNGNVYVNSGNHPWIQKFTSTGTFIKKWGSSGRSDGQLLTFLEHMDIQGGRLHIINNNARPIVSVFDLEGNFITKYGKETEGSANGQFREPEHVTVYTDGHPFVVDSSNFRIQSFKPSTVPSTDPVPVPPGSGGQPTGQINDSLGVKQIYKTKPGGSVWVSTKNGLLKDPQFSDNNYSIKSNGDGTYSVNSGSRIQSFSTKAQASRGPDFDGYATHDYSELKKRGAWDSTKTDWRDIEMTAYIKMSGQGSGGSGDEVSFVARSVRHNNASHSGCGGSAYHGNLHVSGFGRFKKEDWHVAYQNDPLLKKGIGRVNGKTVGFKAVFYNIDDDKAVKIELYIDKDNNNKWEFFGEKTDAGDWTTNGPDMKHCGADSNTAIISWGSPKVIWKWNPPLKVDISKMSVREIIPEKEDGSNPGSEPPPTTGGGDPPSTGGTGQLTRIQTTYVGLYDVIVNSTGQTCAGAAPPSGVGVYVEKTDLTVTTITNDKPLAKNWDAEDNRIRVGWYCNASDAIIHGEKPTRVGVYLKKVGSPTGLLKVVMRDSSGNIKTTYGDIDVSTLTTDYVLYETDFTNDNAPTEMGQGMGTNWKLLAEWDDASGDASNHVLVGVNYNNPIDGTKTIEAQYETQPGPGYSYVKNTTRDMCGRIYVSP